MMLVGGSKQCKSQPYRKGSTHIGQNTKYKEQGLVQHFIYPMM